MKAGWPGRKVGWRARTPTLRSARALGFSRALALLVATGVSACRGDREIREGFQETFDAPPLVAVTRCLDFEKKLDRMRPLFELGLRAYQAVKKFDDVLPEDLMADLLHTPILGMVPDYRCLLGDGGGRELFMGTVANLYLRKGEALLGRNDSEGGYAHLIEGLSVFKDPQPVVFIMHLGVGYFLDRTESILARYPAPTPVLEMLHSTAAECLLTLPQFCSGIKFEYLFISRAGFATKEKLRHIVGDDIAHASLQARPNPLGYIRQEYMTGCRPSDQMNTEKASLIILKLRICTQLGLGQADGEAACHIACIARESNRPAVW
jgi:hypothetical protein